MAYLMTMLWVAETFPDCCFVLFQGITSGRSPSSLDSLEIEQSLDAVSLGY
jgi:hypothetical protein